MTWTQHINPVCALAGRDIVCGPDLWLYYHGLNTWERQMDIREFYRDPAGNRKMLEEEQESSGNCIITPPIGTSHCNVSGIGCSIPK